MGCRVISRAFCSLSRAPTTNFNPLSGTPRCPTATLTNTPTETLFQPPQREGRVTSLASYRYTGSAPYPFQPPQREMSFCNPLSKTLCYLPYVGKHVLEDGCAFQPPQRASATSCTAKLVAGTCASVSIPSAGRLVIGRHTKTFGVAEEI